MSLIEQLGGYEKALILLKGCPLDGGIVDVPNPKSKGMIRFDLSDLRAALLEYRRQHNIFEVGDKVVYRKQCNLIWDGVYDVDAVLADGQVIERDLPTPKEWLSHATDEEIKAGKRLEVKA